MFLSSSRSSLERAVISASRLHVPNYDCDVYAQRVFDCFKREGVPSVIVRWTDTRTREFQDRRFLFAMKTRFGNVEYDKHFNVLFQDPNFERSSIGIFDGFLQDSPVVDLVDFVRKGFAGNPSLRVSFSKVAPYKIHKDHFLRGAQEAFASGDRFTRILYENFLVMGDDRAFWVYDSSELIRRPGGSRGELIVKCAEDGRRKIVVRKRQAH